MSKIRECPLVDLQFKDHWQQKAGAHCDVDNAVHAFHDEPLFYSEPINEVECQQKKLLKVCFLCSQ